MTRERYDALVARTEQYARQHPVAYRIRLGLLALFGYAYIWLILALILGLLALLLWWLARSPSGIAINALIKLGWPLLVVAYAIGRALWVRFPHPAGFEVGRHEAPRLFALVDGLRERLACPRFHHILLTDEWNAGVIQRPRLGAFGWYENYLQLGLPLMSGLAPDEFRAVLAHEFGHLSRSHGRFGSWIYRIRATWGRLLEGLHQTQHRWRGIFEVFLERFAPYFNAYSFVLARAREYEADRVAADLAGRETLGQALVRLALGDALLERLYWPSVSRLAREQEEPPDGVVSRMVGAVRGSPPPEAVRGWLEEALRRKTGTEDTHPSLSERLAALAVVPSGVGPDRGRAGPSAADELLDAPAQAALSQLDAAWREQVLLAWRQQHAAANQARARLQAIEARAATGPLPPELSWERIELTLDLHGDSAAEPLLRAVLATNADHAGANFALGRILMERADAAGLEHLERAMQRDPGCVPLGCALAAAFHDAAGRHDEAAAFRTRARAGADLLDAAEVERRGVEVGDSFMPHGLPADEVERLRKEIAGFFDVTRAYLARKVVRHLPERPYYVLGVEVGRWYRFAKAQDTREVVHGLASKVVWPGHTWIMALDRGNRKLARRLKRVPGAELLRR
jgi:Zn-dependent protease with chaperone function